MDRGEGAPRRDAEAEGINSKSSSSTYLTRPSRESRTAAVKVQIRISRQQKRRVETKTKTINKTISCEYSEKHVDIELIYTRN